MDFYGADTCRELGMPCLQLQTITDTSVSPGWPPITKQTTIRPFQTVTFAANSIKSMTQRPTTTLRTIIEDLSTLSPQEGCFSNDVEDDGDGTHESSQREQPTDATPLSNVSCT